jgi:hypothetical protein
MFSFADFPLAVFWIRIQDFDDQKLKQKFAGEQNYPFPSQYLNSISLRSPFKTWD